MKPSEYDLDGSIVAIATPLVPAALGIVRTTGKDCVSLIAPFFSKQEALIGAGGNTLLHGWLRETRDGGRQAGGLVDEVMLAVYRAPKSFTGEDAVEIMCHGGPAVVLAVYRLMVRAGFRPAERGEFTLRAFVNGKTDLTRSEAVREIIASRTDGARAHAANRLAGGLHAEIMEIRGLIVHCLAAIGVEIEYPEDEETVKGAFDSTGVFAAASRLAALESAWASERLLTEGATIVLAGRTNAGKSSLFNCLLKEDRAIVSDVHGTTRDWLESRADFLGIPVRLFDTAGLRETSDLIEAEGVDRSLSLAASADVILYLVDGTGGLNDEDLGFLSGGTIAGADSGGAVHAGAHDESLAPIILVWNKSDREGAIPPPEQAGMPTAVRAVCAVSAKTGSGIAELVRLSSGILRGDSPGNAEADALGSLRGPAPGTERQKNAIAESRKLLDHALGAAKEGFPLDAVAQDLEDALVALGEITGESVAGDILDAVFSDFCVGK